MVIEITHFTLFTFVKFICVLFKFVYITEQDFHLELVSCSETLRERMLAWKNFLQVVVFEECVECDVCSVSSFSSTVLLCVVNMSSDVIWITVFLTLLFPELLELTELLLLLTLGTTDSFPTHAVSKKMKQLFSWIKTD